MTGKELPRRKPFNTFELEPLSNVRFLSEIRLKSFLPNKIFEEDKVFLTTISSTVSLVFGSKRLKPKYFLYPVRSMFIDAFSLASVILYLVL